VPVVPSPVVGLDSPVTPPPPLTSFTGFRSRIMASFMSFLTRRQADRTILMFGMCFFMFKWPPQLFRSSVLTTSPGRSKPKRCLIACVTWCEQTAHYSLKSPAGSYLSITSPAALWTRIRSQCERVENLTSSRCKLDGRALHIRHHICEGTGWVHSSVSWNNGRFTASLRLTSSLRDSWFKSPRQRFQHGNCRIGVCGSWSRFC